MLFIPMKIYYRKQCIHIWPYMIISFLNSKMTAESVLAKTVKELGGTDRTKGQSSVVALGAQGTEKVR